MFLQILGFIFLLMIAGYFTFITFILFYYDLAVNQKKTKMNVIGLIILVTITANLWWLVYTTAPFSLTFNPI